MPYSTLTFVVGQILTAAQMNALQGNTAALRQGEWSSTTPSSPSPGTEWWDTTASVWAKKLWTGSQWIPMLAFETGQRETALAPPQAEPWGSVPMIVRGSLRTDYAGPPTLPKNMLLNGGMDWWQRGNSFSVRSGRVYTADRWMVDMRATSLTVAVRQSSEVPSDGASPYSMEIQVIYPQPSMGSNDVLQLVQPVEGTTLNRTNWARAGASNWSTRLSFQLWASVAGVFTVYVANASRETVACVTYSYTTASVWDWVQVGLTAPSAGTFHGGINLGLYIGVTLAAGSNMVTSTPGAFVTGTINDKRAVPGQLQGSTTSGTIFRMTDFQWELGEMVTPVERLPASIELPLLFRYFQKTFDLAEPPRDASGLYEGALGAVTDDGGNTIVNWPLGMMRVAPTVRCYNPRTGGGAGRWMNWSRTIDAKSALVLAAGERLVTITMVSGTFSTAIFDRHLVHASAEAELF